MTVEIVAGAAEVRGEGFQSRDTVAQSTATALVTLSPTTNYALLTPLGGTATTEGDGGVTLADGREGQRKDVLMTTTGEISLHHTGTSTGALIFTASDTTVCLAFLNSQWRLTANLGATIGAAT